MNYETDFMSYFLDENKQIWQMIGYCPEPTVILLNIATKEQRHIVPTAPIAANYRKLVPATEGETQNEPD